VNLARLGIRQQRVAAEAVAYIAHFRKIALKCTYQKYDELTPSHEIKNRADVKGMHQVLFL
jgi:hypothetical protein